MKAATAEEAMGASARAMSSLVEATDPAALQTLRRRHPDHAALFETTWRLGEGHAKPMAPESDRSAALQALVHASLLASERAVPALIAALTRRLRRARTLRLTAAVATALGAAMSAAPALGNGWGSWMTAPALLGPGIGVAAALSMLAAEQIDRPLGAGHRSLAELLSDTLVAEAACADLRLRLAAEDLSRDGVLLELARRAGEAAAKLRHVSVFGALPLPTAAGA